MSSRLGILKISIVTEGMKVSTITPEFIRRWRNGSMLAKQETIRDVSKEYADDMIGMGYPTDWIKKGLDSALKGCDRLIAKV